MRRAGSVGQRTKKRGEPWEYVIDVGAPGGKRRQKRKGGFATKTEALRELNAVRSALDEGRYVPPQKIGFGSFLERWLAGLELSGRRANTAAGYRRCAAHVLRHEIASTPLQSLTVFEIDAFYADLLREGRVDGQGGLSNRTVRALHTVLHMALDDATKKGLLQSNPAKAATPPSAKSSKPRKPRTWTPEEIGRFLDHVRDDPDYALWRVLAMTGVRRSEALGLRWAAVDLDEGWMRIEEVIVLGAGYSDVRVEAPKTDESRRPIALDPATVQSLRRLRAQRIENGLSVGRQWSESDWVFATGGRPRHPNSVGSRLTRILSKTDLPPLSPHGFRHSRGSNLAEAGVNPKVIQETLGHSTASFTLDHYVHARPEAHRRAADDYATSIDGAPPVEDPARPITEPNDHAS